MTKPEDIDEGLNPINCSTADYKMREACAFAAHSVALVGVDFVNFEMCPCGHRTTTKQTILCKELAKLPKDD